MRYRPLKERLWEKIQIGGPDECWDWQAGSNSHGYGRILDSDGNARFAHRLVWEDTNGPIPEGFVVMHKCDRPCCCNPNHLRVGTQTENTEDCKRKNRHAHGTRLWAAKLTEDAVLAIRQSDLPLKELAQSYGVSEHTISSVKRGDVWKHVGGPTGYRQRRGRITEAQANEIRAATHLSQKELSQRYNIATYTIWHIRSGKPYNYAIETAGAR